MDRARLALPASEMTGKDTVSFAKYLTENPSEE
jgi:hypothetical protein